MPPAIQVRDARDTDRDVLLRFHESLYVGHRDRVVAQEDLPLIAYRDYERVLADDLRSLMNDRNAHVLIAESGGKPVGYVTGRETVESGRLLPRRGIVEDWFVQEDARGSGIGRRLLEELEKRFIEDGCQVIESATWATNESARQAHDKLGFREIRVIYRKLV
jgi:ribosomal protein S18 acetylase RimI-like enzyme